MAMGRSCLDAASDHADSSIHAAPSVRPIDVGDGLSKTSDQVQSFKGGPGWTWSGSEVSLQEVSHSITSAHLRSQCLGVDLIGGVTVPGDHTINVPAPLLTALPNQSFQYISEGDASGIPSNMHAMDGDSAVPPLPRASRVSSQLVGRTAKQQEILARLPSPDLCRLLFKYDMEHVSWLHW